MTQHKKSCVLQPNFILSKYLLFIVFQLILVNSFGQVDSKLKLKLGAGLFSNINGKNYASEFGGFFNHGYGVFFEMVTFKRKSHSISLSLDVGEYQGINKSLPGLSEYYRTEIFTPAILYNHYFDLRRNQHIITSTGIAIEFYDNILLRTDPPGVLDSLPEPGWQGTGGFPVILRYEYRLKSNWVLGGRIQTYILVGHAFPSISIMPYLGYQFNPKKK